MHVMQQMWIKCIRLIFDELDCFECHFVIDELIKRIIAFITYDFCGIVYEFVNKTTEFGDSNRTHQLHIGTVLVLSLGG